MNGETLDSIVGEINNILRLNEVFKESTTFQILVATKKIMKSFDDARNNKTYAHANNIMEKMKQSFYVIIWYTIITS